MIYIELFGGKSFEGFMTVNEEFICPSEFVLWRYIHVYHLSWQLAVDYVVLTSFFLSLSITTSYEGTTILHVSNYW